MAKYIEGDNYGKEIEINFAEGCTYFGSKSRKWKVELGKKYIVKPYNSQKKKHRDRKCIAKDFELDKGGTPITVVVKFLDTNRIGKVEIDELVELKEFQSN